MSADFGYITKRVTDDTLLNEVQIVTVVDGNDTDTFTLTVDIGGPQTTSALAWDCTAAEMQAALEALGNIGAGNVAVTESGGVYRIEFQGTLASTGISLITSTPTGCNVSHLTLQQGGVQQLIATGRCILRSITVGELPSVGGIITVYDGLDSTGTVKGTFYISGAGLISGGLMLIPTVIGDLNWDFRTGIFIDIGALSTFSFTVAYL